MRKILPILILVIAGLVLVNLAALDIIWLKNQRQEKLTPGKTAPLPSPPTLSTPTASPVADICGPICQETIAQKISEAMATISGKETVKETTVVKETTQQVSQPQIIYVPLGGGGSTTNQNWADIANAEVWLNIGDYTNVDKIYFEGFIKVKHGVGKAYARLYDVTHGIGVQGSEIETTSENYTLVESGSLSLWQGKNLYRVQIKSLTGYEAYFDSGRIRIIIK